MWFCLAWAEFFIKFFSCKDGLNCGLKLETKVFPLSLYNVGLLQFSIWWKYFKTAVFIIVSGYFNRENTDHILQKNTATMRMTDKHDLA